MPFQKIEAERRADAVIRQIELLILRGILRPGERLPAERELADRMGVSRPSLRDAIGDLQDRGLLDERHEIEGAVGDPVLVEVHRRGVDRVPGGLTGHGLLVDGGALQSP